MTEELKSKRMPCLIYSRVCGWLAPTANFNPGKTQERLNRVDFSVDKAISKSFTNAKELIEDALK